MPFSSSQRHASKWVGGLCQALSVLTYHMELVPAAMLFFGVEISG